MATETGPSSSSAPAASSRKTVLVPVSGARGDDRAGERPEWIAQSLEMKTVWHRFGV